MNEIAGMDTWRPIPAVMDKVRITRDGNDAVIEYADPMISDTRLTIGSQIKGMTDKDIIDVFNGVMVAQRLMPAVSRFGRHIRCRICCPIPNPTTHSDCRTPAPAGRLRRSGSTARWCRLRLANVHIDPVQLQSGGTLPIVVAPTLQINMCVATPADSDAYTCARGVEGGTARDEGYEPSQ
jgi:hypothetical protein